jgi:hypothetical protein
VPCAQFSLRLRVLVFFVHQTTAFAIVPNRDSAPWKM